MHDVFIGSGIMEEGLHYWGGVAVEGGQNFTCLDRGVKKF